MSSLISFESLTKIKSKIDMNARDSGPGFRASESGHRVLGIDVQMTSLLIIRGLDIQCYLVAAVVHNHILHR